MQREGQSFQVEAPWYLTEFEDLDMVPEIGNNVSVTGEVWGNEGWGVSRREEAGER